MTNPSLWQDRHPRATHPDTVGLGGPYEGLRLDAVDQAGDSRAGRGVRSTDPVVANHRAQPAVVQAQAHDGVRQSRAPTRAIRAGPRAPCG